MKQRTHNSREDYLEAILIKLKKDGACRVTDIANQIGYTKASTSVALTKLEEEGFVRKDEWRILLTDKGREIAEKIYDRHNFFYKWFVEIGVDEETAANEACMIEHVLSEETFEKVKSCIKEKFDFSVSSD